MQNEHGWQHEHFGGTLMEVKMKKAQNKPLDICELNN